jgi:ADP-heptose:LPS heptosyltransferase/glycosyltransferase involved in cell wall biosynthesis
MTTAADTFPLVSCIMPTANRRAFVSRALEYFARQDYENRELIIVDDGDDHVADLVTDDERVRYVRSDKKLTVGAKRNLACEQARGEIVAHWDDDDWHAPHRLSYQVEELLRAGADACGIRELLFYDARDSRAWRYVYPASQKAWLSGSSLCYRRAFWAKNRFREINVGEDARFVWESRGARLFALDDPTFHVGIIHGANVSPKRTGGSYWKPHPAEKVRALLGDDCEFYDRLLTSAGAQTRALPTQARAHTTQPRALAPQSRNDTTQPRAPKDAPRALVAAAYGVGDILRVTPLVRVFARLGYEVDMLVAPDCAETASLLEGAREIRKLFVCENFRADRGLRPVAGLERELYDCAAFTLWAAPLKRHVRARRVFEFAQGEWLREGDIACVEKIARSLGWSEQLPAPFAIASERRFHLAPNTVALHPGCKPDWQWKKWHGFDELARLLPSVAVIGTESDLRNDATYFRREFDWSPHVQNFVGKLSLRDTAALIGECAALVSNDSGLMHLGVALGTPTFGVFGITSPRREMIPSPLMHVVTKGLDCEPACRTKAWGRRDCEHHLECLKTLTAEEVFERVVRCVPALKGAETDSHATPCADSTHEATPCEATPRAAPRLTLDGEAETMNDRDTVTTIDRVAKATTTDRDAEMTTTDRNVETTTKSDAEMTTLAHGVASARVEAAGDVSRAHLAMAADVDGGADELRLAYYGYVFDASGYGHAARAYIHALHGAGVQVSVVDLANRPRQVRDELVESLVGRRLNADFHLFHGIPPQWAQRAARLKNTIGMTVWETDAMPAAWRGALDGVIEVWLPCDFNVSVFQRSLSRPVFKLPHPLLPSRANGVDPRELLRASADDFVFYSIFEWQDRKSPQGLLETYLREFRDARDAVLFVKTNPHASRVAADALARARERTKSRARVELRAEGWGDSEINALHARGDCYVSLHRGEGWCYPLFEAATRGTPVVATNYSGPLEYLSAENHELVRYQLAQVRQPYVYYHPRMRWAEPDLAHAAELMRRVYENRDDARARAARAATRLREQFSLEAVGRAARAKLLELANRTQRRTQMIKPVESPARTQTPTRTQTLARAQTPTPAQTPPPTTPVPGSWYDADYFERGIKSNWQGGYSWRQFEDLFRRSADFLASVFPEAKSFLDAGCAKGFLVRALRERGKDCHGFDHSAWAMSHADEAARPFLTQAGVDDFEFARDFDVLLAFSLLESLTEDQTGAFLARARAHTRQALFTVIASFETDAEREAYRRASRDLSQITLRPRRWWHEQFLAAGWRQDALHRVAQQACQAHPLPARMNWKVFVYAP